jgi:hypothetical protein
MWDRLIGALGVLWGGFILVSTWSERGLGGGGFTAGQYGQMVLALAFIGGGAFYFLRRRAKKPAPDSGGPAPGG